jgi:hypothetical protein
MSSNWEAQSLETLHLGVHSLAQPAWGCGVLECTLRVHALLPLFSYQAMADRWSCRSLQLPRGVQKSNFQDTVLSLLKFRSQSSKRLQTVANIWKTDLKRCFTLSFGFSVFSWSYFGGLGQGSRPEDRHFPGFQRTKCGRNAAAGTPLIFSETLGTPVIRWLPSGKLT